MKAPADFLFRSRYTFYGAWRIDALNVNTHKIKRVSFWLYFCCCCSSRKLLLRTEGLEAGCWLQKKAKPHHLHSWSVGSFRGRVWSSTVHCGIAEVLPRRWPGPQWNTSESLVPEPENQMEKTELRIRLQCREKRIWERWRRKPVGCERTKNTKLWMKLRT